MKFVQHDLDILVNYYDKNQLTINASKNKTMLYTYKLVSKLYGIKVKGQQLESVDSYTYLGVLLDGSFHLKKNLIKTVSRINHKIWMLSHFRSCLDDQASVFSGISFHNQKRLQVLQNTALRYVIKY